MSSTRSICQEKLPGLEDDILDYIVEVLDSYDNNASELSEMISGFLVSADAASEEDAENLCSELLKSLGIGEDAATSDEPSLLAKPTILAKTAEPVTEAPPPPAANFLVSKAVTPPEVPGSRSSSAGKVSKKASASQRAQFNAQELEADLEEARVNAARVRSREGAYKGALECSDFTLANPGGGIPLLENASCTLVRGRRYGLIGRNGKGKSTMLRALAARRVGNIPPSVTVHYVSQEVELNDITREQTPVEIVLCADVERRLLLEEMAELENAVANETLDAAGQVRQMEVIEQLDLIDADTAERRAMELLKNLGFSDELRARPLKDLSGGWRVRAMLAAAIFARPDLLLLDEPTNHLSILAVMWLARELSTAEEWKERIVVVVSHDRFFIDEVCTDVLHISGAARRLTQSHGNYTTWVARRQEQQLAYSRQAAGREAEIEKLKEYAGHGFRYGGSASQINKMKMKASQAEKLEDEAKAQSEELADLREDIELPLTLQAGGEEDGFLVQMINVGFGYPSCKTLFSGVEFGVTSDSRIVLLGENGNGKTTLVKLIIGALEPTQGEIRRAHRARFSLVNQHHADQIPLDKSPLQFMLEKFPGDGTYDHEQKLRGHLASCGVTGGDPDLQNVPSSALSGGQRSRVALAAVSYTRPHVLILDEPTNNLDLESVAALVESVKTFKGAVIVVSHDQFFVTEIANEAWVVNGGEVRRVESFAAYRKKQLSKLNKLYGK